MGHTTVGRRAQVARLTTPQRDGFWAQGWLHVPGALSAKACDAISADMWERFEASGRERTGEFMALPVFQLDRRYADVVDNPAVIGLVAGLLGEGIRAMSTQYVIRFPGPGPEVWHADGARQPDGSPGYPECIQPSSLLQLKVAYALNDLTGEGSGMTRFVPGSHRLASAAVGGYRDGAEPPGAVGPPLAKGDAVLFHQSLWHRGANVTRAEPRLTLFYGYCHVWMRPFDYDERDVDASTWEALTPVHRSLLRPRDASSGIGAYYFTPDNSLSDLLEAGS